MNSVERRAIAALSSVLGLRMFGLFLILPVLALYAGEIDGATPIMVGIALGVYGLTQAIFQVPFGLLSDRLGRKPLLIAGLLLFALGGWLFGLFGGPGVFTFSAIAVLAWLILVVAVPAPKLLERRTVDLVNAEERDFSLLVARFRGLPGVHEVTLLPGENIAYLKVDPERFHNESLSNLAGIRVR